MRDNKERRLIIDLKGIKKRFFEGTENEIEVLKGIDLQVYEGEFVSIVGASGSGKSTLMNIIGVLDRASEGSYLLDGVDINQADDNELSHIRNKKIGFVFQTYNLIPRISALKNVERPMLYAKVPGAERTERAKELLRHSNQKIYEIALDVGYLSTTAFHVAFKKQTGLTPAEYRNQMGESSVQI